MVERVWRLRGICFEGMRKYVWDGCVFYVREYHLYQSGFSFKGQNSMLPRRLCCHILLSIELARTSILSFRFTVLRPLEYQVRHLDFSKVC